MTCVLLVTRDPNAQSMAARALAPGGHEVIAADGCDAAMRNMLNVQVDAIVIDGAVGEDEIGEFRDWLTETDGSRPMVFLTSAGKRWLIGSLPIDPTRDEVVTKPWEARDIRQAVDAVLERTKGAPPQVMTLGDITLNRESHEVRGGESAVQLTPTEFRLMDYLAQRRGNIVPSEELLEKVWEFFPGTGSSELVRSHVRNLRTKLREATGGTEVVQTVPRRGYRLT